MAPVAKEQTLVVVEDDPSSADLLDLDLRDAGFRVLLAPTGERGLELVQQHRPVLAVLDVGLPDIDGFEVCRRIRAASDLPILFLTARDGEIDRVLGLELGADDYVTKPFSPRELVLRVGAVLRRAQAPAVAGGGRVLRGGPITVDLSALRATVDDRELDLTPTEFRLLSTLLERRGRVQSRQQLLEMAWDIHARIETRTVDMHVQRLRAKLSEAGDYIETVRGFGYRFRPREAGE